MSGRTLADSSSPNTTPNGSAVLPGELSRSTLGDVLGTLWRARANGVLAITETAGARAGISHAVHLVDGAPRAVASEGAPLGQLVAGGLQPAEVEAVVSQQEAGDARLFGELLCDLGLAREPVLDAMRRQTRERLDALFSLGRATLRFHTALFRDVVPNAWVHAARTARSLSADEFLHGRPRARERAQRSNQDTGPGSAHDDRQRALRLLGLDDSSDAAAIRSAFKRRVVEVHPDHARSEEDRLERTRLLVRLTSAYQRLSVDPARTA